MIGGAPPSTSTRSGKRGVHRDPPGRWLAAESKKDSADGHRSFLELCAPEPTPEATPARFRVGPLKGAVAPPPHDGAVLVTQTNPTPNKNQHTAIEMLTTVTGTEQCRKKVTQYAASDDRKVVLAAVEKYGRDLQFASEAYRNDRKVVLTALRQFGSALQFASMALKADRKVVLAAVEKYGLALEYASEELKADREVAMVAVGHYGPALQFASMAVRGDREVVLAAVRQDGSSLQFVSEALQADREVVLAAVRQDGWALQFASMALRGDLEVVLAAVRQCGRVLQFASTAVRADREVVLVAVRKHGSGLQFASNELWKDPFVRAVASKDIEAARKYLEELGAQRPVDNAECDALADKIVEVIKYFPELEQDAQDASARVENPHVLVKNHRGAFHLIKNPVHEQSIKEFEKDMGLQSAKQNHSMSERGLSGQLPGR